jgi:hypothetical protein
VASLYDRAWSLDEVADLYHADIKDFTRPYFTSCSRLPDINSQPNVSRQVSANLGVPPVVFSLAVGSRPPGPSRSLTCPSRIHSSAAMGV